MRICVFCLASLLGGAGSLPAADVTIVFREFAAAAARAGLKCHPFSMEGHRENYCDRGADVSVVGIQVSGPPEVDPKDVILEVHAGGNGTDRDQTLAGIGDRIIDEVRGATKGDASVEKIIECDRDRPC